MDRMAANKGTGTSINASKLTELVFLNHANPIKERKKNKAYREATFQKVLKIFTNLKNELD